MDRLRKVLPLLICLSTGLQLDVWTKTEDGERVVAVYGDKPLKGWRAQAADPSICRESPEFSESDFIQIRTFFVSSDVKSTPTLLNVTATSRELPIATSPPQLDLSANGPLSFSVSYGCNDFNEGRHSVEVRLESGKETVRFFYAKTCGRPKYTNFDTAFVAVSMWEVLLAATAPLLPTTEPIYFAHFNAKFVGSVLILLLSFFFLLGLYELLFYILFTLTFFIQLRPLLSRIPLMQREIVCPFLDRISLASGMAGLLAIILALLAMTPLFWLINDLTVSLFFLAAVRTLKVECSRCCFLLLFLGFLSELLQIYYEDFAHAMTYLNGTILFPFKIQIPTRNPLAPVCSESSLLSALVFAFILDYAHWRDGKTGETQYYVWTLFAFVVSLCATAVLFYFTDIQLPVFFLLSPLTLLVVAGWAAAWLDLGPLWMETRV